MDCKMTSDVLVPSTPARMRIARRISSCSLSSTSKNMRGLFVMVAKINTPESVVKGIIGVSRVSVNYFDNLVDKVVKGVYDSVVELPRRVPVRIGRRGI